MVTAKWESRRAHYVDLAAEHFDKFGYYQTSMDDLATACGIAKPSLYHYFSSKDEILFLVHESFNSRMLAGVGQRRALHLSNEEQLKGVVQDHFRLVAESPAHVRVFFEHLRDLPPDQLAIVRKNRLNYFRLVRDLVIGCQEEGRFRPGNARLMTLALFGTVNWSYTWFSPESDLSWNDTAEFMWSVLTRGMRLGSDESAMEDPGDRTPLSRGDGRGPRTE